MPRTRGHGEAVVRRGARALLAAHLIAVQLGSITPCAGEAAIVVGDSGSMDRAIRVQVAFPDSQLMATQVDALQRIATRLEQVERDDWWEEHAVPLALVGTILGMVATLFAVGVAHWFNSRSKQKAADATMDALLSEAIEDLQRLCYITELHCVGGRSKASIPRAARQHLMSQLASTTSDSAPLAALTRAYSDFDRVSAYQDRAVESDAKGEGALASYAQGVAVAFVRSSISSILRNLDEVSSTIGQRVRIPDDLRRRAVLIEQFRDDPSVLCVIGTVCVKTKEGTPSVRQVMKHLHYLRKSGFFSERIAQLLRRTRGTYIVFRPPNIELTPSAQSATRGSSWNS